MADPRIFMVLGALFGFFHAFKIKGTYSRIITWASIVAIGVMMINKAEIAIDGYYLFTIVQIGIIIYAFSDDTYSQLKKILLVISAAATLLPMLLFLGQNPFFNLAALLCGFIQLSIFIYALVKIVRELKEEMGFLVMLSAFALIHFLGGILFFAAG
jgi:hypothetical protein